MTGRPPTYPLRDMVIGDVLDLPVPTRGHERRIRRNVSMYAARHRKAFTSQIDRDRNVMVITRHA